MSRADPVAASYDRLAPEYDRRWRSYETATLRAALDALPCRPRDRLLDVACGTGELERRLLARCPDLSIVGTDLSAGMLEQAAAKELGPAVAWVRADAARLPFADESFGAAVCANSFHYFRRPGDALREVYRVLRPGATLVLVDWCDDYLACKVCGWWLRWADPAFFRTYGLGECRRMLEGAGFEVRGHDRFRVGWLWGLMRFTCRRPERPRPVP